MYAAIDIGGSKTLASSIDDNGVIIQSIRFETPKSYDEFLRQLAASYQQINCKDFKAGGLGLPATHLNRKAGIGESFGNLPWLNVPIDHDVEQLLGCPFVINNDAKLAALSEAMMVKDDYSKVLYVTVSTGIGIGLVIDGVIDDNFGDGGGRTMLLEHKGKLQPWESFASGKAIVARYGRIAAEIDDEATWKSIVRDLAGGFLELIALTQPEVVVIGGSVGTHFPKYGHLLRAELKRYETPLLTIPPIKGAERPEQAVLYGCYDLAKATFSAANAHNGQD